MVQGRIFDIKEFSVHDGPGVRTTVFFNGCPLCCEWCHNPEGMDLEIQLCVTIDRCISCGKCADVCPVGIAPWFGERCTACGRCVPVCPVHIRENCGKNIGSDELTLLLNKDEIFFKDNGGGITFSGGEPLYQPEFFLT